MMKFHGGKTKRIQQNRLESELMIRGWVQIPLDELYTALHTTPIGLTQAQADAVLENEGENIITVSDKNTPLHRLREATINPFNIVLIAIAVIMLFTDVVFSDRPDYLTVVIILALILISSAVAFVQGERSNKAAEALGKMISNKADVWRDGVLTELPINQVCPGDLVKLSAGDMIPADVRFLTAKDAFVAQAALTGESQPVEKFAQPKHVAGAALTDIGNVGFMGSNMVSGSATALVLATGNATYFGSMAKTLSGDRAKNSFERGVDSVSRLMIRLMLVMVPVVLVINGMTKGDWLGALLFAVTIAVGLTPEMLPVIMTSTLAKGAVTMARHQVIVKTLGAIQTFGEMDVLCTDKTGTLTEDRIVLEKYMNLKGEDDARILRHAYLNSHFQTGLKNLIDLAIINRARESGLSEMLDNYGRVDEIPFDFARRRMSVVLESLQGKRQLITKGAVEEILSICKFAEVDGRAVEMTDEARKMAIGTYERFSADGLRMIAVAQKNEVPGSGVFSVDDERDMVLIGFVGFLDPPKASARAAIAALKDHGVRVVVLTGDAEGVAVKVCSKVGIAAPEAYLTGRDVERMDDHRLLETVETCNLFAKLSPAQKQRVVRAMQVNGHTVGYMGDGINDAPPLHQADVGISVDSAVDIAKETADIILMKKDLTVLEQGVVEGRRTFGNIVKYIKMAASGNFGNMISVLVASVFLPFLPMLPMHILVQNLLCDFSQMGIPLDHVDRDYLQKPQRWETASIQSFMWVMGPLSSLFDIACFGVMWWAMGANSAAMARLFQCGWFVFGTVSQVLVIHMIRTARCPIMESNASMPLYASTAVIAVLVLLVGFSGLAASIDLMTLPASFVPWLALLLMGYCVATQWVKGAYIRKHGVWL